MTKWAIPDPDCALCPRLSAFIQKNRDLYPDFFNAPVPSFGDEPENVQLLIVQMNTNAYLVNVFVLMILMGMRYVMN